MVAAEHAVEAVAAQSVGDGLRGIGGSEPSVRVAGISARRCQRDAYRKGQSLVFPVYQEGGFCHHPTQLGGERFDLLATVAHGEHAKTKLHPQGMRVFRL